MSQVSQKYSDKKNPWQTKRATIAYENPWIRVSHEEVITPAGTNGIYGRVHFKNLAVGVLALDEDDNVIMVGQYRYPLDEYTWEIPEGGCPYHEDTLEAAKRELQEETGFTARKWQRLGHISTSNCITDEMAIYFLATDLVAGEASPEETEDLQLARIPFSTLLEDVRNGKIHDAITVAAVLQYALFHRK